MVSVSANASGYATTVPRASVGPAGALAGLVVGALALALVAPLDVFVFGLLLVGVTHVVFELRYVIGRFPAITRGHLAIIVQAVLLVIALGRLAVAGGVGARGEILGWGLLLVAAVLFTTRSAPGVRLAGLTCAGLATGLAYSAPDTWVVVQVHLHNVIPALFVWDWSRSLADRARTAVRTAIVGWVALVPLLLVSGVLTAFRSGSSMAADAVSSTSAHFAVTPPAWREGAGALPDRLLAAFAFAQLVHYGIWCLFLPRFAPDVTRSFEATAPGRWLRGWRLWAVALTGTALVAGVGLYDYGQGRTVYTAFGAYHAYLEFPVLAAMLALWATRRSAAR